MSATARGRHVSGRSRNSGSAGRSNFPRATRSSPSVDDTTTTPPSAQPINSNTELSDNESTSSTGDNEEEHVSKRRRLTKSRPRREKAIEEGDESDQDLPPLELSLRESPEILDYIYLPDLDRP